jgi:hypothetical protein
MNRRLLGAAAALLAATLFPAAAQPGRSAVPTLTRPMHIAQQSENRLLEALKAHDEASLAGLLADDFHMVVGPDAGFPVLREDWLASVKAQAAPGAYTLKGLTARDVAGQVLASFTLEPEAKSAPAVFVVDLWQPAADGSSRLLYRFASLAKGPRSAIPGDMAKPHPETTPKRY